MTTKTRTKRIVLQLLTLEAAAQEMKEYAEATSELKSLEAELEQRINGIKEAFQEKITHFQARRNEAVNTLQNYAFRHHPQLFKRKKSYDFACGTIGFRETPPKVIKTTKKTWKELLGTIKSLCPELIRSKEDINKELMIDRRADGDLMTKLGTLGVVVAQEETFFCASKEEDLRD